MGGKSKTLSGVDMGVYVENENRVKRSRAKKGASVKTALSKSAFVYKAKNGGKNYQRTANDRRFAKGASKEVMVKITGSAKTKQGIKNSIDYIGREGDVPLMDEKGNQYHANDIDKVKERIIDSDDKTRVTNGKGKNNPDVTKNLVFSPPVTAKVKPEEALKAVREVLNKKYPESRFVLAYHDDKKDHPHVHAIMRVRGDTEKAINIRKQDLRELRTGFCNELQGMGYDVKATHKQQIGLKQKLEADHNSAPKRQKGIYEVVDFGRDNYLFKSENKRQNYITVKTLNKGTETTYWGKEFGELCQREKIEKGHLVRLNKTGSVSVKVPEVNKDGERIGWKETKRNQWELENIGLRGVERSPHSKTTIEMNSPENLIKLQQKQAQFKQNASEMLRKEKSITRGISIG